jgi:hypothetical protein
MSSERVVLIEFCRRGRDPFMIHTVEGDLLRTWDVDRATRALGGEILRYQSGTGGSRPYLESSGDSPYWCEAGYEPENDRHRGKNRIKRRPRGKFGPDTVLNVIEETSGSWCDACCCRVPEGRRCKHGVES